MQTKFKIGDIIEAPKDSPLSIWGEEEVISIKDGYYIVRNLYYSKSIYKYDIQQADEEYQLSKRTIWNNQLKEIMDEKS